MFTDSVWPLPPNDTDACRRSNSSAICWRVRPAPPLSIKAAAKAAIVSWPFRLSASP
jgi:hypothetical protein